MVQALIMNKGIRTCFTFVFRLLSVRQPKVSRLLSARRLKSWLGWNVILQQKSAKSRLVLATLLILLCSFANSLSFCTTVLSTDKPSSEDYTTGITREITKIVKMVRIFWVQCSHNRLLDKSKLDSILGIEGKKSFRGAGDLVVLGEFCKVEKKPENHHKNHKTLPSHEPP